MVSSESIIQKVEWVTLSAIPAKLSYEGRLLTRFYLDWELINSIFYILF